MKKCLAIVAVCLMATPAMAGEVPQGALADLGLGGMQVMSDAQGMQVRGKSSNAVVSGTSLIFGQIVADLPTGTSFVAGSDVNHYYSSAENAGLNAVSQATGSQGSGLILTLGPIVNLAGLQFQGTLTGQAGQTTLPGFAGTAFASGF
jgi:hypothetical protein